jgi:hypothetical protein
MKKTMKQGVLALALLGSAALFAGPAVTNSIHDEGDFGGGYRIIDPGGPEWHAYVRHHTFRPYYDGPAYSYGYGKGGAYDYDYDYGPPRPGFLGPRCRRRNRLLTLHCQAEVRSLRVVWLSHLIPTVSVGI